MKNIHTKSDDYQKLKAFLRFYFEQLGQKIDLQPEHHPVVVLEELEKNLWRKHGKGLRWLFEILSK